MKINKRYFKLFASVLLCVAMLLCSILTSCNGKKEDESPPASDAPETVEVVRVAEDIKKGSKIISSKIEVVSVDKASLPDGTILNEEEVLGKFTLTEMYAGEYFLPVKIADVRPPSDDGDDKEPDEDTKLDFSSSGYVIVTDCVKPDTGEDVSEAIQKLIDENPGSTLYFPDGKYIINKPVVTSADPARAVSFKLANYAHFIAGESWEGEAMFRLGAADAAEGLKNEDSNFSVEGGIFDGSDRANAITVENAGTAVLRYISIKNAIVGIHVKANADGSGPVADIHTVNIVGSGTPDSIGVQIDTDGNTLTNMRIASNLIAIKLTGKDNFLRNLHPLYIYEAGLSESYAESCAFYDEGERNFYDNCYNDQFAVGFYMGENTASIYDCCFNYWYSDRGGIHIAFACEGKFNSSIRSTAFATNHYKTTLCEFLIVGESGGAGVIESVFFNPTHVKDNSYSDYIINEPIY